MKRIEVDVRISVPLAKRASLTETVAAFNRAKALADAADRAVLMDADDAVLVTIGEPIERTFREADPAPDPAPAPQPESPASGEDTRTAADVYLEAAERRDDQPAAEPDGGMPDIPAAMRRARA